MEHLIDLWNTMKDWFWALIDHIAEFFRAHY